MPVRKRGDSYQADFTVGGKRFRKDFETQLEAEQWEAEEKLAALKGDRATPASVSNDSVVNNYSLDMLVNVSYTMHWQGTKNEKDAHRNAKDVAAVLAKIIAKDEAAKPGTVQASRITEGVIDEMIVKLKERGNADGTINRKLSALSIMLDVAKRRGLYRELPSIKWRDETGTERVRYYTRAEEGSILEWFEKQEKRHMADLITLLLDCGCRLSEALGLTWRDIEKIGDGEPIRVWHKPRKGAKGTKNGTSRSTYQSIRVAEMLTRRKAACPVGEQRVFWDIANVHYVENWWTKMRVGIKATEEQDFVVHACRHTWASRCAMEGVPLLTIKEVGGWRTMKMVERYAHLCPNRNARELAKLNTFVDQHA